MSDILCKILNFAEMQFHLRLKMNVLILISLESELTHQWLNNEFL